MAGALLPDRKSFAKIPACDLIKRPRHCRLLRAQAGKIKKALTYSRKYSIRETNAKKYIVNNNINIYIFTSF
jgi:hypothetical protein